MSAHTAAAGVTCLRTFRVRVRPGQHEAYAGYLREVVEPIDRIAHADDVFARMWAITPQGETSPTNESGWTHCRVFGFRDADQRDRFADRMAQAAAQFDGSDTARDRRKAHADTLREALGARDYAVGGID